MITISHEFNAIGVDMVTLKIPRDRCKVRYNSNFSSPSKTSVTTITKCDKISKHSKKYLKPRVERAISRKLIANSISAKKVIKASTNILYERNHRL